MTNDTVRIIASRDLAERGCAVFVFRDSHGLMREGFVIRFDGLLHGYLNCCPHQPLSLDYGDGDFFTPEGDLLLCRNHGALFEPATGRCVEGPCHGAFLRALPVHEMGGWICFDPGACPQQPDLE